MSRGWRATCFGAALYLLVGANLPYLPVWMEDARGFSGAAISGIVAAATLVRIFAGPMIAAEAERSGLGRMLGVLSLVSFLAYAALAPGGPVLLTALLVVITYIAWGALAPLTEGLFLAATKNRRPEYGVARAIASSSFIASSLIVGALVRAHGSELALWAMIGATVLMCLTSLILPPDVEQDGARRRFLETLSEGFQLYRNRRLLLMALGVSLIQSAHAYYYNLGSNVWIGQGIDEGHIGGLWSTGVAAEVVLLLVSGWLFMRVRWTPGALILLGGAGAVLRWTAMGFAPPLEYLYPLQALHALTFAATHIGGLRFLEEELAPEKAPVAMSINSAIGYGPMLAVFGLLTGVFYDMSADGDFGGQARGYWLMAMIALAGCLCTLAIVKRVPPKALTEAD